MRLTRAGHVALLREETMTTELTGNERMSFATYARIDETTDTFAPIRDLGLESNCAELDEYGYTVVPREKVISPSALGELRERITELAARSFGIAEAEVGPESAGAHRSFFQHYMLAEGGCFEQALMNPVSLALITHLLGESCVLSSMGAFMKGPSEKFLDLHTDNVAIPAPFPPYSQVANSTLILSDYSPEDGSITFVPRSHKLARHPTPGEVSDRRLAVAIEAPAGSLIVFHGNTWHGALPRRTPGYRFTLISYFVRMYLLRQEDPGYVTQEMRDRNDPRFRRLVGDDLPYPFSVAARDRMFAANAAGKYQHT
jgi:ectoine hydroxylase-related dioxygenase (phytanoyl-CoA dioxygenase family)